MASTEVLQGQLGYCGSLVFSDPRESAQTGISKPSGTHNHFFSKDLKLHNL